MRLPLLLHPGTRRRRRAWWLCATGVVLLSVIVACTPWSERSLALLADPARLQHPFDAIRLALANVRGALAPDSSCQPALKGAMAGIQTAVEAWMRTWP